MVTQDAKSDIMNVVIDINNFHNFQTWFFPYKWIFFNTHLKAPVAEKWVQDLFWTHLGNEKKKRGVWQVAGEKDLTKASRCEWSRKVGEPKKLAPTSLNLFRLLKKENLQPQIKWYHLRNRKYKIFHQSTRAIKLLT